MSESSLKQFYDLVSKGKPLSWELWSRVDKLLAEGVKGIAAVIGILTAEVPPLAAILSLIAEEVGDWSVRYLWSLVPHVSNIPIDQLSAAIIDKFNFFKNINFDDFFKKFAAEVKKNRNPVDKTLIPAFPMLPVHLHNPPEPDVAVGIIEYPATVRRYAANPGRQAAKRNINPTFGHAGF